MRGTAALRSLRENEHLLLICTATVVIMAGQGVVAPVLPLFARSFGVSAAVIGFSLSVFGLARLLLNVPLGIAADRYGRRLLLVGGPVVTAVGMIGTGLAPDVWVLLVWRFVAGAGSAMYMTCAQIYLADISTAETRARYIATNQGALFLGVSAGPAIGGVLAQAFGLRSPFFVVGGLTLLAAVHAFVRLPETRPPLAPTPPGARPAPGPSGRRTATDLLRSPSFVCVALVCLATFLVRTAGQQTLIPLYATGELGLSPGQLGVLFTTLALINLVGLGPATLIADRFGRKWAIVPSGLVAGLGLVLLANSPGVALFVAGAWVFAAGLAVTGPAPAAYAADIAPVGARGLALGMFRSAGDLGIVVGPPIMGAIADWLSVTVALEVTALVMAAAVVAFGCFAREVVARPARRRPARRRRASPVIPAPAAPSGTAALVGGEGEAKG